MDPQDETRQLHSARDQVCREFSGHLPGAEVARVFDEVVSRYAQAPVRTFVGVLAQREARQVLRRQLVG